MCRESRLVMFLGLIAMLVVPAQAEPGVSEYDALEMSDSGIDRVGTLTVDTPLAGGYIVVGLAGETNMDLTGVTVGELALTNSIGGGFDTLGGNRGNLYLFYEPVASLAAGEYIVTLLGGATATKGTDAVVWLVAGATDVGDVAWKGYRDDDNGGNNTGGGTGNVGFNLASEMVPIADVSTDMDLSAATEGDLAIALFYAGADIGTSAYTTQISALYGVNADELNVDENSWQYTTASGLLGPGAEVGAEFELGWYRAAVVAVVFSGGGAQPVSPTNGAMVTTGLSELCWTNPDPNSPADIITCDVYFGTTEPNAALPGYGLDRIVTATTDTCVPLPYAVAEFNTYYWLVDCYDSSGKIAGRPWSFHVYNNKAPQVEAGPDVDYVWLGNGDNPAAATVVLDGTASDDNQPPGAPLTILWEQVSGPAEIIDPNGIAAEDVILEITQTGTYQFKLTADDTDLTTSDTIQIVVAANACAAAKAVPGYQAIAVDLNDDCIVDLKDLALVAAQWLECNSLRCPGR